MSRSLASAVGFCALAACASQPDPTEHLAASMAAVRGAETAGAAQVPQAALHLKLADEQAGTHFAREQASVSFLLAHEVGLYAS